MQYVLRRAERAHSQAGVGASLWPVEDFFSVAGQWGRGGMAAGAKRGVKRDELGGSMPWRGA